jgi:hypothetical protein
MLTLLRFLACYLLACVLMLLLLGGLLFAQQFAMIELWLNSGQPLAGALLALLPASLWNALTGITDAASHPQIRSFLALLLALGQLALLPAIGFYRVWYRA